MKVALRKLSLIDYPGRVACVLFLPGCNFRCPYCQNADLVFNRFPEELVSLEQVYSHVETRSGIISAAVISGGEPLIHNTVPDVVAALRQRGLLVKLDTNGSLPERILACDADYYALDLKTAPARYGELWQIAPQDAEQRILASLEKLRGSGKEYELRITCAPGIFGPAEAESWLAWLKPDDQVVLQRYQPENVLDPAWAEQAGIYTEADLARLLGIIHQAVPSARLRNS